VEALCLAASLFSLYVEFDPSRAVEVLQLGYRQGHRRLRGVLAEATWCASLYRESEELWNDIAASSSSSWLESLKLARHYELTERPADAMVVLEALVERCERNSQDGHIAQLLYAQAVIKYGAPSEVLEAKDSLRQLARSASGDVRADAQVELSRIAVECDSEPSVGIAPLKSVTDLGALALVRLAQISVTQGNLEDAKGWAIRARRRSSWGDSPLEQLECFLTAFVILGILDPDAEAACRALQEQGWWLPGRPFLRVWAISHGPDDVCESYFSPK